MNSAHTLTYSLTHLCQHVDQGRLTKAPTNTNNVIYTDVVVNAH